MNAVPARRPVTRAALLLAVAIALAATWVLILSPAGPAATRHVSQGQLSAARHAVDQSGVRGIAWYVDGASTGAANIANNINGTDEFHKPFFVLLNVAVGGSWPGSPDGSAVFPQRMSVDWIYWN